MVDVLLIEPVPVPPIRQRTTSLSSSFLNNAMIEANETTTLGLVEAREKGVHALLQNGILKLKTHSLAVAASRPEVVI